MAAMAAMAALSLTVERLRTLWSSEKSMAALMVEPLPVLKVEQLKFLSLSVEPLPVLTSRFREGKVRGVDPVGSAP